MAMKIRRLVIPVAVLLALMLLEASSTTTRAASQDRDVRAVVQRVFDQLKAGQYNSLYETLPSTSRARISRERFNATLQRTRYMYALDRIDVGAVRVSNNLAVVDTVMYGRVLRPMTAEGKIVVQQYLVREEGSWRVATGDNQTIRRFLSANPGFGRKFSIRSPLVYVKQNGRWIEVNLSRLPGPKVKQTQARPDVLNWKANPRRTSANRPLVRQSAHVPAVHPGHRARRQDESESGVG